MSSCSDPTDGKKIILSDHYFNPQNEYCIPKIAKQMPNESDETHANRLKEMMLLMSDDVFAKMGHIIDHEDPNEANFFMLYTHV